MNLKPVLIVINIMKCILSFVVIACLFVTSAHAFTGGRQIFLWVLFQFIFAILVISFSFGIEVCLIIPVVLLSFLSMIGSLLMMMYFDGLAYIGYLFMDGIQITLLSIYFGKHKRIVKKKDEKEK